VADPYLDPYLPMPAPPKRPVDVAAMVAATVVAVIVSALGLAVGWLWAEVSPRLPIIKVDGGFIYGEAEPEQPIAADGWFAILGAGVGLLIALLAWFLLRRYRGTAMVLGLTIGSLIAACLAWWVGYKIGMAQFDAVRNTAAVGSRLGAPLRLRLTDLNQNRPWPPAPTGVAAIQALVVAFVYTVLAGFSAQPDLREADQPYLRLNQPYLQLEPPDEAQLGPNVTGSSDSGTGTDRT
jgi:hypothetical protein